VRGVMIEDKTIWAITPKIQHSLHPAHAKRFE